MSKKQWRMENRKGMRNKSPLRMAVLLWAAIFVFAPGNAYADRREMQTYDLGGVNQAVFSIERGLCTAIVDIDIQALSSHLYDFDQDDLFSIAGNIALVHSFECSQVKKYRIAGYVNGRLVFAGAIISDDWSKIETSVSLP